MVSFRQVTITNEAQTERIELNDFDGYLMTAPTGFGVYRTSEYITVGNQRITTNNRPTFQKITFNVLILGERADWEKKYANLRNFISRNISKGFRLYYTPDEETRYIKCDINILDKTEKDRGNLPVKLEIQPLSLWLRDVNKQTITTGQQGDSIFSFAENSYDEYSACFNLVEDVEDEFERQVYAINFVSISQDYVVLNNTGVEDTPLVIRIYGEAVNPFLRLSKQTTGEMVQYIAFNNLTIPEGFYLEISSEPMNTHIELVNTETGERYDKEDYADIESNIYMTLPTGVYVLTIDDDVENNVTDVFFSNQYYGG